MSYQALARKWRPRQFADVLGQEHVVRALVNALDNNRLHHAFLFTGTRGVGKTTLARILAKSLNCENGVSSKPCGGCAACEAVDEGRFVDLIEVDAASRTKVDDTRELLDNVQYAPTRGRYKVYLIDEVHMLSGHSFNALLKTLEEPPPHVKFLFATTDPQKLPVTVLSRCLQFNLKPLHADQSVRQLTRILDDEGIAYDQAAINLLARAADGSLRDALSLLDQAIAHGGGTVMEPDVRDMLGTIEETHIHDLLQVLADGDADAVLAVVAAMTERTPDYLAALDELLVNLYHISLAQVAPDVLEGKGVDNSLMRDLAVRMSREDVQLYYQIGLIGKRDLPLAPDSRSGFEMVLMRMLAFQPASVGQTRLEERADSTTPTATRQSPAAVADQPAKTAKAGGSLDIADWPHMVQQLELTGLLNELASHTAPKSYADGKLILVLEETCGRLLNKDRKQALKEALVKYCGMSFDLEIITGTPAKETPAKTRQRVENERQRAAAEAIQNDPNTQALIERFNATVDPDSIRPKT